MARAAGTPTVPPRLQRALRRLRRLPAAPPRRHRAQLPAGDGPLAPAPRPYVRALGMVGVALLGAWLGLFTVGSVRTPVGPMDTTMALQPSVSGGTRVQVAPLGALELRSHHAPVRLAVQVDQLDQQRATALVDHPERFHGLQDDIVTDVRSGLAELALHSAAAVLCGATALGLVVYRRPRRALAAGGLALSLFAVSGGTAYATWNPDSLLEPKFSGLLASAPSVVGNARSIVTGFEVYQRELARLVTNVSKLYEKTSTLPSYQPDPGTIRVLHVSDIHLNPGAWHIVRSLVDQYDIDVVVDTGDTMDHGSTAENGFLNPAARLGAPYVWVRGNHDSPGTQRAVQQLARRKNSEVHVLDGGTPVNVAGLRLAGWGDPQFTPDRSVQPAGDPAERRDGRKLARALREQRAAGTPVDVAAGHNPLLAAQTDGQVPLTLTGHTHQRSNTVLPGGTHLMTEGSTGGGGLRAVEKKEPQQVQASVLYLGRTSHRLQAWDEITLGGLGLTSAEVARHLPPEAKPGGSSRSPDPSLPSPSGTSPTTPNSLSGTPGSSR